MPLSVNHSADILSARRYLAGLLGGLSLLLAVLVAFNALMDVYDVLGVPRYPGINAYKHGARENSRIGKVYGMARSGAKTVILGSSRAEMAYDPAHPALLQPAYNLSVEGASLYELRRLMQHALAVAPVNHVIIGVDFFAFRQGQATGRGFEETRLAVDAEGRPTRKRHNDLPAALLSASALNLSLKTFWAKPPNYRMTAQGFREYLDDHADILARGGFRQAFLANERNNAAGVYGTAQRPLDLDTPLADSAGMAELRNMVQLARQSGVRLTLLLYPKHVRQQALIAALGLWNVYQDWKTELLSVSLTGEGGVDLWDFSTLSAINTEAVPPAGDATTRMRYYREGSHATRALGDAMLERVMGGGTSVFPAHFGVRLTSRNLMAELHRQRLALIGWEANHPEDVREIRAIVSATGQTPAGSL